MQYSQVCELLCFGVAPGGGNAALVVQHDHSSAEQRQQFARERNKPACVFIDTAADGGIVLDFFYPHMRSPLCSHATLAAARVLLSAERPRLEVRSAMHGQPLTLILHDDEVFLQLSPQPAPQVNLSDELAQQLLAAPGIQLASPPAIASVGSPKLLLEVADSATLQALTPDLQGIAEWGKQHGVSGAYAWCRRPDGALSVLLKSSVTVYQGANLGTPCQLRAEFLDESILIGGKTEFA